MFLRGIKGSRSELPGLGVVIKEWDAITMANPSSVRMEINEAKSGGVFDSRNGTILKASLMSANMPAVASQYLLRMAPVITERFEPEGTLLELFLKKNSDKSKGGRDHHDIPGRSFRSKASEIAESIGLKPSCTRDYLNDLISGGHRDQGRKSKLSAKNGTV